MERQAYINGKDIWTTWGARLERGAYEALLTPPSVKGYVENKSRLNDGTQVLVDPLKNKVEERNVSLVITMRGHNEEDYLLKYHDFVNELQKGWILLKIPGLKTEFKLLYESCTKFGNYKLKAGKFSLRLREPNPNDREEI